MDVAASWEEIIYVQCVLRTLRTHLSYQHSVLRQAANTVNVNSILQPMSYTAAQDVCQCHTDGRVTLVSVRTAIKRRNVTAARGKYCVSAAEGCAAPFLNGSPPQSLALTVND